METVSAVIKGTRFIISADSALLPFARFLFGALEGIPEGKIRDGYRLQIGFSLFICQQTDCGYQMAVPDYTASPFQNTSTDLTLALWILVEQAKIQKLSKAEGVPTRFDDEIVVAKGALNSPLVSLQRYADLGKGASGWCIEALGKNEDGTFRSVQAAGYESVYAYQLLRIRPGILKVLSLPSDYFVIMDGDEICEILNEKDESILKPEG